MSVRSRRHFVRVLAGAAGLGLLPGCEVWTARQFDRGPRIGWLRAGPAEPRSFEAAAFLTGLHDQGYVEGQSITVEWRFSHDGDGGRFSDLAAELVALPVQVIVTSTTPALVAATQATGGIPIVSGGPNRDVVDLGLAQSYAHPGGNVTGTGANLQVYSKLVDLLKQTVPAMTRMGYLRNPTTPRTSQQMTLARAAADQLGLEFIELQARIPEEIDELLNESLPELGRLGVLWNAANPGLALAFAQTEAAAPALGITVLSHGVRTNEEVQGALDDLERERPDALIVLPSVDPSPLTLVPNFGASHGLPVMYSDRSGVDAG
jgi:ABC-type uncharacterized transport system substrate-binding protein